MNTLPSCWCQAEGDEPHALCCPLHVSRLPNPSQLRAMARPAPAPKPCMPGRHCERRERGLGACIAGHCNPPAPTPH